MPKLRKISGHEMIKILCNKFGFTTSGQSGSHVRLSKMTSKGKVGTVVPLHKQLRIGTLKSILRLANQKNLSGSLESPFLFRDAISLRASDGNRTE